VQKCLFGELSVPGIATELKRHAIYHIASQWWTSNGRLPPHPRPRAIYPNSVKHLRMVGLAARKQSVLCRRHNLYKSSIFLYTVL
jgi:hypothetical protein